MAQNECHCSYLHDEGRSLGMSNSVFYHFRYSDWDARTGRQEGQLAPFAGRGVCKSALHPFLVFFELFSTVADLAQVKINYHSSF